MWLTLAILSYFLLSLSVFFDKYILGGELLSPKLYSFYVGILALAVLFIIPIGILLSNEFFSPFGFSFLENTKFFLIPNLYLIGLGLLTGIISLSALFFYYQAINDFEISRIGPAVGGTVPIFSLLLIYLFSFLPFNFSFEKLNIGFSEISALFFLILGSIILTIQKEKLATLRSLKIALVASFLFGLTFVLSKIVYNFLPFLPGFIWIRMGEFLGALSLLLFSEVRNNVFKRQTILKQKIALPFVFSKTTGALSAILQNRAIFLAPVIFLPVINALAGIQYVFLIILATLFFFKFPAIFKEQTSKKILLQKIIGIFLILIGLSILT
jgi:hypothetical protein